MSVERRARTQMVFREVNDRIRVLSRFTSSAEFLCECDRRACTETIELDVAAYEAMREFAFRFVVVPEHVDLEIEVVCERAARYVVVEKVGAAAQAVEDAVSGFERGS